MPEGKRVHICILRDRIQIALGYHLHCMRIGWQLNRSMPSETEFDSSS